MAVTLSLFAGAGAQFLDNNGNLLSGGFIYTYSAGTTTPLATYTDNTGNTALTNPIVLDSAGRMSTGEIWLTYGQGYKFVVKTSTGTLIGTYDNIPSAALPPLVNDAASISYEQGASVIAGNFIIGQTYLITFIGSTNFQSIGASANTVGIYFTATGVGSGTGTAQLSRTVQVKLKETVSVEDFGAVGNGIADDTVSIQTAINSLSSGQTLNFAGNYKITASLTITNKSNIRLTGKGKIFLSNAASNATIFNLVGTLDNLEIDNLTLIGDGVATYTQSGIACNSGQTISNSNFHDLNISELNVGISHNANLGGSWDKGVCYNNSLKNISGTVPGSGYGIHMAKASNIRVYDNVIDNASRHSIYQGSGVNVNNVIHNNLIINHRSTVATAEYRCAIACSRSSDVTISNNKFLNCYDGQIEIDHETASTQDCSNILVIGNTFTNRKNLVPSILVGEQLTPTTNATFKITIQDNIFDCDYTTATGSDDINVLNGTEIFIEGNKFRRYSYTGSSAVQFIELGADVYLSSDAQLNNVVVKNNVASIDANATNGRFCAISQRLCTGTSTYTIKDNTIYNIGSMYYFEATPTNLNSKFKFSTTVTYTFTIPANTTSTGAFSISGVKPTSSITGRPQYTLQVAPQPAYTFFANDNGVNAISICATNASGSASNQVSQAFLIFVEDF